MSDPLLQRLLSLCGRRIDDPEIVAFHEEQGLGPPPRAKGLYEPGVVRDAERRYKLEYSPMLRRLETWPPRMDEGGFVTYLQLVALGKNFAPHMPPGIPIDIDETRAKAIAVSHQETPNHSVYRLLEVGESTLEASFSRGSARTRPFAIRLTIDELDEKDPRLAPFPREAADELSREATRRARAARPKSTRVYPKRVANPTPQPLLPALEELRPILDAENARRWALREAGQGSEANAPLDFVLYPKTDVGGPTAYTNNPEAEAEFCVFGADGTGSLVAFWLVHDRPLAEQPVVFLGSEGAGEIAAVAKDLTDFLALIAAGVGPREARSGALEGTPLPEVKALLARHFPSYAPRSPSEIVAEARATYGHIEERLMEELNLHE